MPTSIWKSVPTLVRTRFAPIWDELPQLTVVSVFPGWGATVWLEQCVAHLAEHEPETRVVETVTRAQLRRHLNEVNPAEQLVLVADSLVNAVDDNMWPRILAELEANPRLRVVMTSVDTPPFEQLYDIDVIALSERDLAFTEEEVEALVELTTGRAQPALATRVGEGTYGHPMLVTRQLRVRLGQQYGSTWRIAETSPLVFVLERSGRRSAGGAMRPSKIWQVLHGARSLRSFSASQLQTHFQDDANLVDSDFAEMFQRFRYLPFLARSIDFELGEERLMWAANVWQARLQELTDEERTAMFEQGLATARAHGRLTGELHYLMSLGRFTEADALVAGNYQQILQVIDDVQASYIVEALIDPHETPALSIMQNEVRWTNGTPIRELLPRARVAHAALRDRTARTPQDELDRASMLAYTALFLGERARTVRYLDYVLELSAGPLGEALQGSEQAARSRAASHFGLLLWVAVMADQMTTALRLGEQALRYGTSSDRAQPQRQDSLAAVEDFLGLRQLGEHALPAGHGIVGHTLALRLVEEGRDAEAIEVLEAPVFVRIAAAAKSSLQTFTMLVRGLAAPESFSERDVQRALEKSEEVWNDAYPSTMSAFAALTVYLNQGNRAAASALVERVGDADDYLANTMRTIWDQWHGEYESSLGWVQPEALGDIPRFSLLNRVLHAASQLRLQRAAPAVRGLNAMWREFESSALLRWSLRYLPRASVEAMLELEGQLDGRVVAVVRASLGDAHHVEWYESFALTRSEIEVLELLDQGLKNTEVASERHVTIATVRSQLKSIYRKLGAAGRAEALEIAHRNQLLGREAAPEDFSDHGTKPIRAVPRNGERGAAPVPPVGDDGTAGGGGGQDSFPRSTAADK
ncbi:helix-turn-helix transcriptional regulator [Gulosibacter sp. ACHW.36C]|uniref:Helix-turn-helix transcriptional regulator n=1 Tax=Gulosibacter sediminis TaxID=1729695 RepID=A0ABY4MX93_9MICO|nr:helix-turn-helix transcriptional regulator [Gulosibacter sediminis]UQN15046.1 helix-turn-helix transcriptional regulator [Gulosibacter sediminis]